MVEVCTQRFPGLLVAISPVNDWEQPAPEDIEADLESEREAIPSLAEDRDNGALPAATNQGEGITMKKSAFERLIDIVRGASKGVTERTDSEYCGQIKKCAAFLIREGLINKSEDFFCSTPPEEAPELICAWIMEECDVLLLDGNPRPSSQTRNTYAHAQKMRASMSYAFSRIHRLGSSPWHVDANGKMIGNPSVSEQVASYMVSLRRRKIHAGETATSARAVTPDVLKKMWDHNHQPENYCIRDYAPGTRGGNKDKWGGARTIRELEAIYTLANICLLRVDEVLKIQLHHIKITDDVLTLTLPYRKTHQFGSIKPFFIHPMPEEQSHLCAVRAVAEWMRVSKITRGYLFRRMASGDRIGEKDVPMSSEQFLELFRNNLLDVGIDPYPYGTHSFRRGGCQYLASYRWWPLRRICDWGGWSTEFSSMTIVKYLISWNDDPIERREDFLDPNRGPAMKCFACGRSCHCA